MNRLSRRMDAEVRWPPHGNPPLFHWENPLIPSGYTYLLQFIAHDLVQSAMLLSVAGPSGMGMANARRSPLQLDTLYGSGPVGSPHIYALDASTDDRRTKLRLGRMRWKESRADAGCPFRDVARTGAENVTGIDRNVAGLRLALTEALVADPRNDDHAILSQFTALLAILHNALVDLVREGEPEHSKNDRFNAAYRRFLCVRDALTSIYHGIIRQDVMRRVLHPVIYASYSGENASFIHQPDDDGEWRIPLEFSHGAFQFGHAMVRPEYDINDLTTHDLNNTLEKTSANDPANMPLDETWMVQWSRFFQINATKPNFSRRIGPHVSSGLGNDQFFPALDETERVGLVYRDLMSAALSGMWSVDALIAEVTVRRPDLVRASRLMSDRAYRTARLRNWLTLAPGFVTFASEDIETLSNDPPLPFFVLFEAMEQAGGLHLGVLGSVIVAEVIFGALGGASSTERESRPLAAQLGRISQNYYSSNLFSAVPEIKSMAQLVQFTAEIAELQHAVPAFL